MNTKSSTFGLSAERLVRLLNIGSESRRTLNSIDQEEAKAKLLQEWLSASLPLDEVLVDSLPKILARVCRQLQPLASESFGNLLQDPQVDIEAVKKIKDYSKKLVKSAKSEVEHDAAAAIYYAAIANALVFHERRITKLSYESLGDTFSEIAESKWISPGLVRLFKNAESICKKKGK
jgi:hypothetical protein